MFCVCHFAIEERYYILLVNGFLWNLLCVGVAHCLDNDNSELCLECFADSCAFILSLFDPGSMYGITTA